MATGSTLGQVCRAAGHVTPAGTLLAETTFLFPSPTQARCHLFLVAFTPFSLIISFSALLQNDTSFSIVTETYLTFKCEMCNCCATSINKMEWQKYCFQTGFWNTPLLFHWSNKQVAPPQNHTIGSAALALPGYSWWSPTELQYTFGGDFFY